MKQWLTALCTFVLPLAANAAADEFVKQDHFVKHISTVPANAGSGLVTGATIDQAFLLANNPGASLGPTMPPETTLPKWSVANCAAHSFWPLA